MNIYKREWERNRKSLIIWSISIALLQFLQISVYPNFADNLASTQEFFKLFPEGMLKAFGMDQLNMGDILSYFGFKAYLLLTLFGGMFAILLSANMIVKEESDKTIEFLLTKPVTRSDIVTQKLLLIFTNILLFNLFIAGVSYISFEIYKTEDYNLSTFALLFIGAFLLHATFASIGLSISVFLRKTKTVYPLSIGLVLGTYFLNIIANTTEQLEFLKYLSPFKYVDAPDILLNSQIDPIYLSIMLILIILSIGITYFYYSKKDITI